MKMNVKKIKENIKERKFLIENTRNTIYGSLVQSAAILLQKNWSDDEYLNRMKKGKFPYIEDPDFIKKTVEAVGIDYNEIKGLPLCIVESDFNTLILPYVVEDDCYIPMPINHEGILPSTVVHSKSIKVIDWDNSIGE